MTRLLAFVPKRYHHFVLEYGALTLASVVALIAAGAFFLSFEVEPHHHDGYHLVKVDVMDTIASDTSPPRYHIYSTDENGAIATAKTRPLILAQGVDSHACVERRSRASGRNTYVLMARRFRA